MNRAAEAKALYRANMSLAIKNLRYMYEPRPTPWTGQDEVMQDQTTDLWLDIMQGSGVSIEDFRDAGTAWMAGDGAEYFPSPMDLLRIIAKAQRSAGGGHRYPECISQCDGSGWIKADDGRLSPCGRCNAALAEVFSEPGKLRQWLDDTPLSALDVGVDAVRGMLRWTDRPALDSPCSEFPEPPVPPATGLAIAKAAYEEQCREAERVPDLEWFTGSLTRALGRPVPEAPVDF